MNSDWLYWLVMKLIWLYQRFRSLIIRLLGRVIKKLVIKKFEEAGISVYGGQPHELVIHDERMYHRIVLDLSLGFGESYMDGWWDCEKVDELYVRIANGGIWAYIRKNYPDVKFMQYLQFSAFNLQTPNRSWEVAWKHYDLGNALYESFLDSSMNYSCGYWRNAETLEEAQLAKMELIARKLHLKPGMRVLDIGCGWGGLCKFLAEKYQVQMVGITVSEEGAQYAREKCKGLPVEIRVQDYRDLSKLPEEFDCIVSVGMFEHVGQKNYRKFFEIARNCLPPRGLLLLQTIGIDSVHMEPGAEPWYFKYIFPNSHVPDHRMIARNCHNLFTIEDWHNFGADYDLTLMAWYDNFVRNWPKISHKFEDPKRFYRMWTYYLLMSAGFSRARKSHLWQIVFSKGGVPQRYESVR